MMTRNKFEYSCRPISLAILLLGLFLFLSGCKGQSPAQKSSEKTKSATSEAVEINLKETRFAVVPEDYEVRQVVFSDDGSRVVYVARNKEGKEFVAVGDEPGPLYDHVWEDLLALSADGQRFAYSGKREGKWYFVLDGKEEGGPYEDTGITLFSPDGRFVICDVKNDIKWSLLVYDGTNEIYHSPAFFGSSVRQPLFSLDGRLLGFEYFDDNSKEWTLFILDLAAGKMIRERRGANYVRGRRLFFSSDSSRVLYVTQNMGKQVLVLIDIASNEERSIELPYTEAGMFVLSPDGKKVAYVISKRQEQFLVVGSWESPTKGKEFGHYEGPVGPVFSPDATAVAYQALREGKWLTVVGGKEGPEYDGVARRPPVWSPDGSKIVYPAMKDGKWVMVVSPAEDPVEVVEGPEYDVVVTPVWSPDGKYLVYRARRGTMQDAERFIVIADGETGRVIKKGPSHVEVWPPVWSADGKFAAYGARQGRELWWRVEAVE